MWLTPDGFCSSLTHFLRLPDTLGQKEPIDLLPLDSFKQSMMETLRVTMHSGAVERVRPSIHNVFCGQGMEERCHACCVSAKLDLYAFSP